jgi:RNA polymerase sigma-70 factor (ECF subfamily)
MREAAEPLPLSDGSVQELAGRLLGRRSSPSGRLRREERRRRVQAALERLPEKYREVLVLRHLEQLSTREIAAILGVTEGAVYTRHVRALDQLRRLLGPELLEEGL